MGVWKMAEVMKVLTAEEVDAIELTGLANRLSVAFGYAPEDEGCPGWFRTHLVGGRVRLTRETGSGFCNNVFGFGVDMTKREMRFSLLGMLWLSTQKKEGCS